MLPRLLKFWWPASLNQKLKRSLPNPAFIITVLSLACSFARCVLFWGRPQIHGSSLLPSPSEPLCPSSSNLYLPCPDSSFSVLGQVGSNAGIVGMTKEHLGLALALNVPVFVVVTKIDMCPANILQGKWSLQLVAGSLLGGCHPLWFLDPLPGLQPQIFCFLILCSDLDLNFHQPGILCFVPCSALGLSTARIIPRCLFFLVPNARFLRSLIWRLFSESPGQRG